MKKIIFLSLVFFFFFTKGLTSFQVAECRGEGFLYSDEQIIKAIISEAIGEPEEGIVAVAYTFKTRIEKGMNLGSCWYKRKDIDEFIARQPKKKVLLIKSIWSEVKQGKRNNPVPHCTYFENVEAFGNPPWIDEVILVKKIGNHSFFRRK